MNYKGEDIAKKLGCSTSFVNKWGRKLVDYTGNKPTRTYYANFNYFENIDCPKKAYWLGFIMADGCVRKRVRNGNAEQGYVAIVICDTDRCLLEEFKQDIDSNAKITYYEPNIGNQQKRASLVITSDKVFYDLGKYGIVPQKTNSSYLENIPEEYIGYAILGLFDGDGSIFKHENANTGYFGITCNEEMANFLETFFSKNGVKIYKYRDKRTTSFNLYNIRVFRLEDKRKVYDLLYKDCDFGLKRKKDKFKSIVGLN